MACGCKSMRGFGAFGDDASKVYYLDMNQRGQVRVLKDELLPSVNAMLASDVLAVPSPVETADGVAAAVLGTSLESFPGAIPAASWINSQLQAGKRVALLNVKGELSLALLDFASGSMMLVAAKDEELIAGPDKVGPNGEGPSAIGWGYTPVTASNLQPGGGGGGGFIAVGPGGENPAGKPFWETPWPYAIGGAVLLGGALLLISSKKK